MNYIWMSTVVFYINQNINVISIEMGTEITELA